MPDGADGYCGARRQKAPEAMFDARHAVTESGHFFSAAHLPRCTRDSLKFKEENGIITSISLVYRRFPNALICCYIPVSFRAIRFHRYSKRAVFRLSYPFGVYSAQFPVSTAVDPMSFLSLSLPISEVVPPISGLHVRRTSQQLRLAPKSCSAAAAKGPCCRKAQMASHQK